MAESTTSNHRRHKSIGNGEISRLSKVTFSSDNHLSEYYKKGSVEVAVETPVMMKRLEKVCLRVKVIYELANYIFLFFLHY